MMHALAIVAVAAVVTIALRALPFVLMRGRETPPFLSYLGRVLSSAIMPMLVVYCLRATAFTELSGWLPQLIAVAVTAGLHLWRHNTLLSIVSGTAVYMLLVQLVF